MASGFCKHALFALFANTLYPTIGLSVLSLVQKGRIRRDSLARITRDRCVQKERTNARAFGDELVSRKHGVERSGRVVVSLPSLEETKTEGK